MKNNGFLEKYKVIVVGGGFSGLICSLVLNEKFKGQVLLLERNDRLGKKIASTGNGRGNITNENVSEKFYHGDKELVKECLSRFSNDSLIRFFNSLGILFTKENGRIYPSSMQASSVCDVLRLKAEKEKLAVKLSYKVTAVSREKGGYMINSELFCEKVVICVGGKSMKNFGTDGNMVELLQGLGEKFTPLSPSLVQLKTDVKYIKGLRGIKQVAKAALLDGEKEVACFTGDVLFTDYGVSGDCVFRLSAYLGEVKKPILNLEFLPDYSFEELSDFLKEKSKIGYVKNADLPTGVVNNRLGLAALKKANLKGEEKASYKSADLLAKTLKNFTLDITGTLGFDYSQVTHGGVDGKYVDKKTLQSTTNKNLYYCGEILNVDGDCGGYNLQWAYTSARIVAEAILNDNK